MKTNYIAKVINLYFKRNQTDNTQAKIQQWLLEEQHAALKNDALHELWKQVEPKANKAVYDSLKKVNMRIGINTSRRWFLQQTLVRVAAVLLPLIAVSSIYLYNSSQVEMIEVITLVGERKELTLPDGSTVWINGCSKVTYPNKFNDATREIQLVGEAYFSVEKSQTKRFIVSTKEITVKVLGTQFNVKAYPDDQFITATLASGSIAVSAPDKEYTLRPNQELIYNSVDKSSLIQTTSLEAIGWKDGNIVFNDVTIYEIFKVLERQYDIKINYKQNALLNDKYSLKFTHDEPIEQVISVLQDVTGVFSYSIDHKTITILTTQTK